MTENSAVHIHWLEPLAGVNHSGRVIVSVDQANQSLTVLLPDGTQVVVTADRAICITPGDRMRTLTQWQDVSILEYEPPGPAPAPSREFTTAEFTAGEYLEDEPLPPRVGWRRTG